MSVSRPRLDTSTLPQPYVSSKGSTARVNAHGLLDNRNRNLADKPKRIQDPIIVRNLAEQVSPFLEVLRDPFSMKKIIPKNS